MKDESTLPKINFQPVKLGKDSVSIVAYINYKKSVTVFKEDIPAWGSFGTKEIPKKPVREYTPARVTTGVVLPTAFWDNTNKKAIGSYSYQNDRLKEFTTNVYTLYESMVKTRKEELTPSELSAAIKEHITSKIKSFETGMEKKEVKKTERPRYSIPNYFGSVLNGQKTNLIDFITSKIEHYKARPYIEHKKQKGTIEIYQTFVNKL